MNIKDHFEEIIKYAHYWNWQPDWGVVQNIYESFTEAYSVLTPFAYSYLEEVIRSTTSEYGREIIDENGKPKWRNVGNSLINLAIKENSDNQEFITILEQTKSYFTISKVTDCGDNRNSVGHGYLHPRFWDKSSFEKLIHHIARLSKFARF